ncbi:ATP-grasp domain-containing protein [Paenibacillus arenosi]|uniref:ATP-grasp domain-containing protein n=1 Tax=Paenibacillus arenosi TaxID=2774142 RepID=A0ABR9AW66_9BACL|nr:ATP-grasp domain-containing protein [Paenibacillus arenosi]MBD8497196.1 ATP-grasp domain-containing protein [Paenibacillus arenosi]
MTSYIAESPIQLLKPASSIALWYANMNDDQAWNTSKYFPVLHDPVQAKLVIQQEQQLLWIAESEDTVLFHHQPEDEFLAYVEMVRGQGTLPHIQRLHHGESDSDADKHSQDKELTLLPFLLTEQVRQWSYEKGWKLRYDDADYVRRLNDKYQVRRFVEKNGFAVTKGYFCHTPEQLEEAYRRIQVQGFTQAVLKSPHGSSGKGLSVIDSEAAFHKLLAFIRRRAATFELLLEAWHPIKRSLNAQISIQPNEVHLLAITEQRILERGIYVGTDYAPQIPAALRETYENEMLRLGHLLQQQGYTGVIGVDSIVDELEDLYPIIEINGRFTQVTYLLPFVESQLHSHTFVESRYIRLDAERKYTFSEMKAALDEALEPDIHQRYVIYTYAAQQHAERWHYRVFLLFLGQDADSFHHMIDRFERFTLASLEGVEGK